MAEAIFQPTPEGLKPGNQWNDVLRQGRPDPEFLRSVGRLVAGVVAGTKLSDNLYASFDNFRHAAEPPFTAEEDKAFLEGFSSVEPAITAVGRVERGTAL